jgi:hypothetical protein
MRGFAIALVAVLGVSAAAADVLYSPEGNRLRRYDIDSIKQPPLRQDVLIERASLDPERGRDINGMVCLVPDGSNRFIAGEDTGQPAVPPGWGVFAADGTQVGKLTATYFVDPGDPFGCAFDSQGRLFTTEIGNSVSGAPTGQLIMWFPPYDRFPGEPGSYPNTAHSTHFCKIATTLGTSTSLAIDEQDRIYVTSARTSSFSASGSVIRFSPPFPTAPDAAGGCGAVDALGSPVADAVQAEVFIQNVNVSTPSGIARARNGNWYVASVLNGVIGEFDRDGRFVRRVLEPAQPPGLPARNGNPQGIAVDADGDLYFADLQLTAGPGGVGPGANGKVRWIHFDAGGSPSAPMVIRENLAFPDALGILPGSVAGCTDNCGPPCPGDCNGDGTVRVNEIVLGVNIALGNLPIGACDLFDANDNLQVTADELVSGVGALLDGCPQ